MLNRPVICSEQKRLYYHIKTEVHPKVTENGKYKVIARVPRVLTMSRPFFAHAIRGLIQFSQKLWEINLLFPFDR